jgi:hypothetical protein
MNLIIQSEAGRPVYREILVMGDGQEDEAEYLVAEANLFAAKHGQNVNIQYRPTLAHHGTGNVPRALGLDNATQEWVMFIDSGTSVVHTAFELLAVDIISTPDPLWRCWDLVQLVDPVPTFYFGGSFKFIDKSAGLPYVMPGVASCLRRDIAQATPWPNTRCSDWAYYGAVWKKLREDGHTVEDIENKLISFIPATLTVAYGASPDRRLRDPASNEDFFAQGNHKPFEEANAD